MPHVPYLTLVDPRAQQRAALRRRLLSLAAGVLVAGASAIPYALTLGH